MIPTRAVNILGEPFLVNDTPAYKEFWDRVDNDRWEYNTLSVELFPV